MAGKKRQSDGPSKAYLVSFGDTMTALLAFFIVLNSLAKEQTGANLYAGTGSFITALKSFGLPGLFTQNTSDRVFQAKAASPIYAVNDAQENPSEKKPVGPDDEDNRLRVIDREKEQFERFLNEMAQLYHVNPLPRTQGRIVYDLFERLNQDGPPLLMEKHLHAIADVVPLLRRPTYRVQIVVWATTPNPTAWRRATEQSAEIRREIIAMASLRPDEESRLQAVGKPWLLPDAKRPVLSIVVTKNELP